MTRLASVVIPAYRSATLRATLESLLADDQEAIATEVIVVLNDASAEVRQIAQQFAPEVRLVEMPVNLGVAGAFNHGFGLSKGDYLVQMQDDATVEPGWLDLLVEAVDSAPDVGGAGALKINHRGEVRDAGWVIWRDGSTTPALVDGDLDPDHYRVQRGVDYHGSVGMVYRRAAWESVGGLDDSFYPAYYGDTDFCCRLRARGWRVLLEPRARVHHSGGSSTSSNYRIFLSARNRLTFLDRHQHSIAGHGEYSDRPSDLTREVERAASSLAGPRPQPATADELKLLRERIELQPEVVLRRERDTLAAFAGALTEQLGEAQQAALSSAEQLADSEQARIETERQLLETTLRLEEAETSLEQIRLSRSWRWTAVLRRTAALLRNR